MKKQLILFLVLRGRLLLAVGLLFCSIPSLSQASSSAAAVRFDGSTALRTTWHRDTTDSFSFEVWVRPTNSGHPSYLLYAGDPTSSGFGIALETNYLPQTYGTLTVGGREEPITGNSTRVPLNTWTHLATVKNGNLWLFYKNGMLVGRGHYQPGSIAASLVVGKGFVGEMSEIRVWDYAISDSEILSRMYRRLPSATTGLMGHYVTDRDSAGLTAHIANRGGSLAELVCVPSGGTVTVITSGPQYVEVDRPVVRLSTFPKHMQLFPRDKTGHGTVEVAGSIQTPGFDSIFLQIFRDDAWIATQSRPAVYAGNEAPFAFGISILAGLTQYTVRLLAKKGDTSLLLAEGADLVAGDTYFINGQSNAHPAIDGYVTQNPYARTFGVLTPNWNLATYDDADTLWGLANGSGWGEWFTGPYLTGAWGFGLQDRIAATWHTPTCVINGGAGMTAIAEHYRNDSNPADLTTVYGRALYRLSKAALLTHVRAIFWYQGEYDQGSSYFGKFSRLYRQWMEDIPYADSGIAPRTTYLFQIRPGCEIADGALREAQRRTQDSIAGVKVLSTTAIGGHDGCHYAWWGYVEIAQRVFDILGRDYYGLADTLFLDGPNVASVRYADSQQESIRVKFRARDSGLSITPDSTYGGKLRRIRDAFFLDGHSGLIDSLTARNGELTLYCRGSQNAHWLTYLPDKYCVGDTIIYEGPWIVNRRGIGVLSFDSIPILPYRTDSSSGAVSSPIPLREEITFFGVTKTDGNTQLEIATSSFSSPTVTIYNVLGQSVQSSVVRCAPGVRQSIALPRSQTPDEPLYFAVARTAENARLLRILIP